MNAEQKKELKAFIQSKVAQLQEEIKNLESQIADVKPLSPTDGEEVLIDEKVLLENKQKQLKNDLRVFESAGPRVDQEDFGVCSNCGDPISIGRLKLLPTTTECINCAGS